MTLKKYTTQKKNIYICWQNNQFIFYKFHKLQKASNKQRNTNIQKACEITMNNTNKEAKEITTKLNIDHKINPIAEQSAFITIKDLKPNFKTNPTYWLINSSKSEVGKISKHILDNINTQLMDKIQLNKWKNTKAITNWFTSITNKNNTAFIQFDITDFYPSITKYTLDRALELAAQHVLVSQYDIRIIKHCHKLLLFHDSKPWIKNSITICSM